MRGKEEKENESNHIYAVDCLIVYSKLETIFFFATHIECIMNNSQQKTFPSFFLSKTNISLL
jgi:hypothetical protein